MPLTVQTSPCSVQTAASPFSKKSWPVKNMRALYGFLYGTVIVSMTYGSLSLLTCPCVIRASPQHDGPGFDNNPRSIGDALPLTSEMNFGKSAFSPVQMKIFVRTISRWAGMVIVMRD